MSFQLQDKGVLTPDQRANVLERLTDFHRANEERKLAQERTVSANALLRELRESGVSYRRQDMLDDVRRSAVSFRAKSVEGMENAQRFYDTVLEPIRKEYDVTQKEAFKIWRRIQEQDYRDLLEAESFADIWDIYKGLA